jgi:Uma2 family endonuclease
MVAQQVDDEMSGIHPRIVLFLATAVLHLWSEDIPLENDLDQPPCLILPDAVEPDNYIYCKTPRGLLTKRSLGKIQL